MDKQRDVNMKEIIFVFDLFVYLLNFAQRFIRREESIHIILFHSLGF